MGDKSLYLLGVGCAGECVHQIFNAPDDYIGKIIGLSSDQKTTREIAEAMTKVMDGVTVADGEV